RTGLQSWHHFPPCGGIGESDALSWQRASYAGWMILSSWFRFTAGLDPAAFAEIPPARLAASRRSRSRRAEKMDSSSNVGEGARAWRDVHSRGGLVRFPR